MDHGLIEELDVKKELGAGLMKIGWARDFWRSLGLMGRGDIIKPNRLTLDSRQFTCF